MKTGLSIRIENLTFRNSAKSELLWEPITTDIAPGHSLAVVGPSGSGKTTFVNLVMGFLKPETGRVTIERQEPQRWIRKNPGTVSYVPQFPKVILGSLVENIALGRNSEDVNYSKVKNLLEEVGLSEVLLRTRNWMTDQIDSNSLSGGQVQRLGLARALYTSPQLLILDEPTSAVDAKQEDVMLSLLETFENMTKIFITHREATSSRMGDILDLSKRKHT